MKICDRCHSDVHVETYVLPDVGNFDYDDMDYNYNPKSYDLCKRCVRELVDEISYFMKRDPESL